MAKLGDVIDYIKHNSVPYEVIEHVPAYSAHESAVVSHVPEKELAKTLIVHADNKFCMVVMPADHRLDEHLLQDIMKVKNVHLSHEEDFKPLFPDCDLGAMPPFGNLYALPVYIDKTLADDDEIVFNACSYTKSIRLKMDDYLRLVNPVVANFSKTRFETEGKIN
jgi:Ala-tRNA(Pro) deacylase